MLGLVVSKREQKPQALDFFEGGREVPSVALASGVTLLSGGARVPSVAITSGIGVVGGEGGGAYLYVARLSH